MKNILKIVNNSIKLLSSINDGTNRLIINGVEIPSSSWVGTGYYYYGEIKIGKIAENSGNVHCIKLSATECQMTHRESPSAPVAGLTFYGTCSSAADAQHKVASVDSDFDLIMGARVAIKFTNTNTFSATASALVTLNVNNTGARGIYWANSAAPTGTNTTAFGRANYINYYLYNGDYWVWDGSSADNNTTYSAMSVAEGKAGTATSNRVMRADYLKQIIQYYIGNTMAAGDVTFDNIPSGLTANNVQDAIDEEASAIGQINSGLMAIRFTPQIASGFTPNNVWHSCFYIPKTKQVRLNVIVYSSGGLIPVVGNGIFRVPTICRPYQTIRLGMAQVCGTSNFQTTGESCEIATNGWVYLNNFIWGNKATRIFAINTTYYADWEEVVNIDYS